MEKIGGNYETAFVFTGLVVELVTFTGISFTADAFVALRRTAGNALTVSR